MHISLQCLLGLYQVSSPGYYINKFSTITISLTSLSLAKLLKAGVGWNNSVLVW